MTGNEKIDERLKTVISDVLATMVPSDKLDKSVETMLEAMTPVVGAAAVRRRLSSDLRASFREGFMTGKLAGRFSHWHDIIWRNSSIFKLLKDSNNEETQKIQERYSQYNFTD